MEQGVAQRAELLERMLADVYGEGRLVAEGVLPPAALTGSKDYIAAIRGVRAPRRTMASSLRSRHRPRT